ncbi:MAG: SHOCT domain-containing protein [Rubrimonas sp.]|uniref:SHOCT domain-containing protein n=1 Tax=Rubrimonas sp. TaxID=2036015 RepID=UPI002FDD1C60
MSELTAEGARTIEDVAARHGVSVDAVTALVHALARGGGRQAQFSHPELGGMGQWSQGGMTMVGDMFNTGLQARVDALCSDLSDHLARTAFFAPQAQTSGWRGQSQSQGSGAGGVSFAFGASFGGPAWPAELGSPASTGAQNDLRYAVFPHARRLAIAHPGGMTVYDTGDHQIAGVSQQQGGGQTLTFTSQHGLVRADELRVVEGSVVDSVETSARSRAPESHTAGPVCVEADRLAAPTCGAPEPKATLSPDSGPPAPRSPASPTAFSQAGPQTRAAPGDTDAIFSALERLAELHKRGVLTDDEFSTKKTDLLSRI